MTKMAKRLIVLVGIRNGGQSATSAAIKQRLGKAVRCVDFWASTAERETQFSHMGKALAKFMSSQRKTEVWTMSWIEQIVLDSCANKYLDSDSLFELLNAISVLVDTQCLKLEFCFMRSSAAASAEPSKQSYDQLASRYTQSREDLALASAISDALDTLPSVFPLALLTQP